MLKWKLDSVRLEIVLILTEDRCSVFAKPRQAQQSFWKQSMLLLGDLGHVESRFGPCGESVSLGAR